MRVSSFKTLLDSAPVTIGHPERVVLADSMTCAEYWESKGVDALDAMFSVGCPGDTAMSVTGHDVIGGLLFFALLVVGVVLAKGQGQL